MKSHTEYLVFETRKRREMVHITDEVEQIVRRSGVKDGLCFVSTSVSGLKNWPPRGPTTSITKPAKTTETHISRPCCSTTKQRCPSPTASSISAPGSAFSMPSSTAGGANGSSSKFSASNNYDYVAAFFRRFRWNG